MSPDTKSTAKPASKSVALEDNKKQYKKPQLNCFGKIAELIATGSAGVSEMGATRPQKLFP